jgi:hypothetical protein
MNSLMDVFCCCEFQAQPEVKRFSLLGHKTGQYWRKINARPWRGTGGCAIAALAPARAGVKPRALLMLQGFLLAYMALIPRAEENARLEGPTSMSIHLI